MPVQFTHASWLDSDDAGRNVLRGGEVSRIDHPDFAAAPLLSGGHSPRFEGREVKRIPDRANISMISRGRKVGTRIQVQEGLVLRPGVTCRLIVLRLVGVLSRLLSPGSESHECCRGES